jgi:outer membrane lipoprotein-sorting protein
MRNPVLTAFLALTFLPALSGAANAQTLTADQVVEKHLTALGGRDALAKLTSRRATGTISVDTPMGALAGLIEMSAKTPNKMRVAVRIDLTAVGGPGEMIQEVLFDGTTGWLLNSLTGDAPMEGDQLESARNEFFPTPLLRYTEQGRKIELLPSAEVNGKKAYVLQVSPKTGPVEKMFFDAESFMLVRTMSTINSPQLGSVEQVSDASDFRTVDGVKVAFAMAQSAGGQNIVFTFTKIENNVAIDDAVFVKK